MNRIRAILREETASSHQRVDDLFSMLDLSEQGDFLRYLNINYYCLNTLKAPLKALPFAHGEPDASLTLIGLNLEILGAPYASASPNQPHGDLNPFGCAYVISGYHLGRKVLRQRWQASTNPTVLRVGHYISAPDSSDLW